MCLYQPAVVVVVLIVVIALLSGHVSFCYSGWRGLGWWRCRLGKWCLIGFRPSVHPVQSSPTSYQRATSAVTCTRCTRYALISVQMKSGHLEQAYTDMWVSLEWNIYLALIVNVVCVLCVCPLRSGGDFILYTEEQPTVSDWCAVYWINSVHSSCCCFRIHWFENRYLFIGWLKCISS